ncbi:DUF5690 family protein [Flavobacterium pectinovorum]|uniref:DUF5690 family protein n=1 Tax=Flavobacterium pectinovorum TaxID=29533 RepID=UPI00349E663A
MNLKKSNIPFILNASLASFGVYFCMYAFRKPFTVATFEGLEVFHIDYKILLIIAQVIGYVISKFIGIKIISELKANQRIFYLLGLIAIAEIALVLFAIVPKPYNIIFMFINGVPLGMIWGIVFSYLEGRKFTEILGVALSTSFIVSSGVVKSAGFFVMESLHFSEFWMPAITGLLFVGPLLFFALAFRTNSKTYTGRYCIAFRADSNDSKRPKKGSIAVFISNYYLGFILYLSDRFPRFS